MLIFMINLLREFLVFLSCLRNCRRLQSILTLRERQLRINHYLHQSSWFSKAIKEQVVTIIYTNMLNLAKDLAWKLPILLAHKTLIRYKIQMKSLKCYSQQGENPNSKTKRIKWFTSLQNWALCPRRLTSRTPQWNSVCF